MHRTALIALLLLAFSPRARAEEPIRLVPYLETEVKLAKGVDSRTFRLVLREETSTVHVTAVAGHDVDLYIYREAVHTDDTDAADHTAASIDHLERITFDSGGEREWFVVVRNPDSDARPLTISLTAWEDSEKRLLLPDGLPVRIELTKGKKTPSPFFMVPKGTGFAVLRAECGAGTPRIALVRGDEKVSRVAGTARGHGARVLLTPGESLKPGLWRVEVKRPAGVSEDEAVSVSLEASIAPSPPMSDVRSGDPVRLESRSGSYSVSLGDDAAAHFTLDMLPGVHSFDLTASVDSGDVDLYVRRGRPSDLTDSIWGWGAWAEGAEETLRVGGAAPLPLGRYWVRLKNVSGETRTCRLAWKRRLSGVKSTLDARPVEAAPVPIAFAPNEEQRWFAVEDGPAPGSHLQVLFSDKDIDLAVARSDTGEILASSSLDLNDEYLRVPEEILLPKGVGLLAGTWRWKLEYRVSGGRLHIGRDARPEPPKDYLPPYAVWKDTPRDRALSAAVHVNLDDTVGSGAMVTPTGLVLTCHHVIEEGGEIILSLPTRERGRPRQAFRARVVASDEELDLALLELTEDVFGRPVDPKRRLPFVPLGTTDGLRLGDPLLFAGYGYAGSSSFGSNLMVLSSVLAAIEMENGEPDWILTDAPVGSGNSGGGLFDARFRLIGIQDMTVGEDGGILGYARPTSRIPRAWLDRIRKEGG